MTDALLPRAAVLARWETASAETRAALQGRVVIAFLGPASSGKDSAIRALFGIDFGQIDPIPGTTDRVKAIHVGAMIVLNAPGFGDLRPEVEQASRALLPQIDLAVYLVNCDGGATIDERRDLDQLRLLGRPVLVCLNKIDLIRPHQRESFITTTLAQLGVAREDAVIAAFDPMPALADAPIGVDDTIAWLHRTLERDGKALLLAREIRDREAAAKPIIESACKKAALAGAIPVPGADMAAVTAVQVKLISDLAALYGERLERDLILFLLGEMLAGTSKGFLRQAMSALKTAGWIPGTQLVEIATSALGATLAGAATWGVGQATTTFLGRRVRGQDMGGEELRATFDAEAVRYTERKP